MRYLRTFFKRWYLYAIPIIVLPVVVTAYGYFSLLLYNSSALVFVDKPMFLTSSDPNWNTYLTPAQNESEFMAQLLASESFVDTIAARTYLAQRLDLSTRFGRDVAFGHIAPEIVVTPTGTGPNTIYVSVTDASPVLAQQINQGFLDEYSSYYQDNRLQADQQTLAFYQQQLQSAKSQFNQDTLKLEEYLQQHPGEATNSASLTDPTLVQLQQQVNQDQTSVNNLNGEVAAVQQDIQAAPAEGSQAFRVLDPPQVPLRPTVSKKRLVTYYTGGGLAAALALVALIVAGLTRLDRKLYAIEDLRSIEDDLELDVPAIGALPLIAEVKHPHSRENGSEHDGFDGILVPVLTALPRLQPRHMQRELWRAANSRGVALSSAAEAGADGENLQ